jgi:WD40 repeat protein
VVTSLEAKGREINCLAFSANGKRLAIAAEDGGVRLYAVGKKIEEEPGGDWPVHQNGVGDLVFTPDGKTLVTGDKKGEIKIWNVADHKQPFHTLKTAHKDAVTALTMSPDGKRFASTSADSTVKVWDIATGKEVRAWDFHYPSSEVGGFVRNYVFTPDGKQLITANGDGTLYVLGLPE